MKCAAIPGAPRVAMMRLSAIEQRKCAFESLAEFSLEPAQGMDQRSSGSPRWGEGGNRRRSDGELLPEGRGHAPAFWSGRGAGPSPGGGWVRNLRLRHGPGGVDAGAGAAGITQFAGAGGSGLPGEG